MIHWNLTGDFVHKKYINYTRIFQLIKCNLTGEVVDKKYINVLQMVNWKLVGFTPHLTVFQSYQGDSSHYSCFPGFHQY